MDGNYRALGSLEMSFWCGGAVMMSLSLLVVFSLLLTLVDRWLHSPCGWSCGYTLQELAAAGKLSALIFGMF